MNKKEFKKSATLKNQTIKFIDKYDMENMTKEEYKLFVELGELSSLDSNGVLFSAVSFYPIATNVEQLSIYINKLQDDLLEMNKLR